MSFCDSDFRTNPLVRETIPIQVLILLYNCPILAFIEHFSQDRHALLKLNVFQDLSFQYNAFKESSLSQTIYGFDSL